MTNIIQIKRSQTTATPSSLAEGELAYSEVSGNLFLGTSGGTLQKIGGNTDVTKLAGIQSGAQVNNITTVNGQTGIVSLATADIVGLVADLAAKLSLAGGTMTGALTLNADPSSAMHAATKQYVDGLATGLDVKASVKAATTVNITLSGTQTIDGIALIVGDRVLVKNQSTGSQNGIYVVASGAWARSPDADSNDEVTSGMFTFVEAGTTQAASGWILSTTSAIVVGTTALVFTQFTGGTSYTAGSGIDITGAVISVANLSGSVITSGTVADARLSANVVLNTSTIDGGTF